MVQVEEDDDHGPSSIVSRSQEARVTSIVDVWEIVVTVEGDTTITIFRDLASGAWYKQRV